MAFWKGADWATMFALETGVGVYLKIGSLCSNQ